MNSHLWWYVARSAGLVSWALLSAATVWGLVLSTRLFARRPAPSWLADLHRFLGGLSVVFVGVHLLALVADTYAHFGPAELFVPFASGWRPGPVAWGIVALYFLVVIEVTSLVMSRMSKRWWRRVHAMTAVLFVVSSVHFVTAGSDARNLAVQWGGITTSVTILFLLVVRLLSPRAAVMAERREARAAERAGSDLPQARRERARAGHLDEGAVGPRLAESHSSSG
ncbi:MAG: ferric reductase-like transmembrane domain-containing protein [Actinomycetota bacterium]